MIELLLRPLRQLVETLLSHDSPCQVGAGFTLGMVLGLVPKGTLIAVLLGVLLCALRVSKPAGIAGAGIFSLLGLQIDSITHLVGTKALAIPQLQTFYAWLYDQPLGPWWGFHNTVTLGSLLVGVYVALPCYWASKSLYARWQPNAAAWITRYRFTRWLAGANLAARFEG